jgi:gag-polyprotein putative aspartyl protease
MNKILAIILLCLFAITISTDADERIFYTDAKINGKPILFAVDTGASISMIYSTTARKLGLKVTQPNPNHKLAPGETAVGTTELCNLNFGSIKISSISVIEMPDYFESTEKEGGVLGWSSLKNKIIFLDAAMRHVTSLTNIPEGVTAWTKLRVQTNLDILGFEMPDQKKKKTILIDTGKDDGIALSPQRWHEWKMAHINQPTTLEAYYVPNPGIVVTEEKWADKIMLGTLALTNVSVTETVESGLIAYVSSHQTQYEATLGLAALKQLDIIIDGKNGVAYLRPKKTPSSAYPYNRLGAVFVPKDMQSDDFIAHVIEDSPAYEAGIRNDDVLLKIHELDITKWRTDPAVLPLNRFWSSPVGTKLELALKRGNLIFKTMVTLRNILPPDSVKN